MARMKKRTIVIAAVSAKGGAGKTTLIANLSFFLAGEGRVLAIDADTQPSLTSYFPANARSWEGKKEGGLYSVFAEGDTKRSIYRTACVNIDLVPSNVEADLLSVLIQRDTLNQLRLKQAVEKITKSRKYDYILIDSQGATGPLMDAVLFAANVLLVPVALQALNIRELLPGTLDRITHIQGAPYGAPQYKGVYTVPNYLDKTTDASETAHDALKEIMEFYKTENSPSFPVRITTGLQSRVAYRYGATNKMPGHWMATDKTQKSIIQSFGDIIRCFNPTFVFNAGADERLKKEIGKYQKQIRIVNE